VRAPSSVAREPGLIDSRLFAKRSTSAGLRPPGGPGTWPDWERACGCSLPAPAWTRAHPLSSRTMPTVVGVRRSSVAGVAGLDEPRQRIHGDLWVGERSYGPGAAAVIDRPGMEGTGDRPACWRCSGARTSDRQKPNEVTYARQGATLEGWAKSVPLHQLAPAACETWSCSGAYRRGAGRRPRGATLA